MASRIAIVADIADAVRRQGVVENREDLLAYRIWHPRINTMRTDVVECPELGRYIHDVIGAQHDILQPHPGDERVAPGNGLFAQVQPDEFALRPLKGDRNEVRT